MENRPARYVMALLLWLAALCAYPLAWLRITGERVPFFGDVQLFSLGELGVLAFAVVVFFAGKRLLQRRLLLTSSALILLTSLIQLLIYRDTFEEVKVALFYAAMPLAGMALAEELRRIFPVMASFTVLITLASGVTSPDFTGFTGNWNWSLCLTAALAVFPWYLAGVKKWLLWSWLSLIVIFLWTLIFHRAELSRAVLLASFAGCVIILVRDRITPEMCFKIALVLCALGAMALIGAACFAMDCEESRPALWAGALELASDHPLLGVGAGRFPGLIDPYLPLRYAFTAFPALLHFHAHCEALHLYCIFGIAGAAWFIALLKAWCDGENTEENRPLLWASAIFALCGCLDMTLYTPLCGTLFLLVIGMLAAPQESPEQKKIPPARLVIGAFLLLVCAGDCVALYRSSTALRKGKLEALSGNHFAALGHFEQSLRYRLLPEAAYNAAAFRLEMPAGAMRAYSHLRVLEEESSCPAYGYADRLRGVTFSMLGQQEMAQTYLKKDRLAHPYSVIGARLYWQLLKFQMPTPQAEIDRAYAELAECCRLRQIPVSQAMTITEAQDRAPFAPEIRRKR